MKKSVLSIVAISLLCLSIVGPVVADEKNLKKTMTFSEDVYVNDTIIKKGSYQVHFDAKTNEVSLVQGGKVVVTIPANIELRDGKARYSSALFKTTDKGKQLEGLTFAGDRRAIVLSDTSNSASDGQ